MRTTSWKQDKFSHLLPTRADNFIHPDIKSIKKCQEQHMSELPKDVNKDDLCVKNEQDVWTVNEKIWIPDSDIDLTLRIFITAHCGPQGHRGYKSLVTLVKSIFSIANLEIKATEFVMSCLLCLHTKGGKIIPRPWAGDDVNNGTSTRLHFDFLYIGESYDGYSSIMVMKDAVSHYVVLRPVRTTTAAAAAEALLEWDSLFGLPEIWVSDTGSHFKNQLMNELAHIKGSHHQYTLAYCPWRNGSVERLNRDLLQVFRVMTLEFRIAQDQWPKIVVSVQANLNSTPLESLDNHTPMEVHTLHKPRTTLALLYVDNLNVKKLDSTIGTISDMLKNARDSLESMHKNINSLVATRRLRSKAHAEGRQDANFMVGDYVLWSKVDKQMPTNKLQVTWLGPFQIVKCNAYSHVIQHLLTKKQFEAHESRLKFFRDSLLNITEEIKRHIANQDVLLDVNELCAHKFNSSRKNYEILLSWRGLEEVEDSWEPLTKLIEDVPILVMEYALTTNDNKFLRTVYELLCNGNEQLKSIGSSLEGRCSGLLSTLKHTATSNFMDTVSSDHTSTKDTPDTTCDDAVAPKNMKLKRYAGKRK